jgi:hypothetical protein
MLSTNMLQARSIFVRYKEQAKTYQLELEVLFQKLLDSETMHGKIPANWAKLFETLAGHARRFDNSIAHDRQVRLQHFCLELESIKQTLNKRYEVELTEKSVDSCRFL